MSFGFLLGSFEIKSRLLKLQIQSTVLGSRDKFSYQTNNFSRFFSIFFCSFLLLSPVSLNRSFHGVKTMLEANKHKMV